MFAELEALRVEHDLSVSRFCQAVGLPTRTYYDRRVRHHAGHEVRGPWPTPARHGIRAIVIEVALKYPMWGHRQAMRDAQLLELSETPSLAGRRA